MEKVPLELGFQISKNLPKADLKSLRLVCKNFNSVSTNLLFNRAYASAHLRDHKSRSKLYATTIRFSLTTRSHSCSVGIGVLGFWISSTGTRGLE